MNTKTKVMENSKLQKVEKDFSLMSPKEIVESSKVHKKFVQIYQMMHGKTNGEAFYQREAFNFMQRLTENPDLQKCDKLSLYGAFVDIAVNDLSADKNMKQVYLVPFRGKCVLMISPYGELHLRTRSGQIKHADNPVLVYEGDSFSMGTRNGGLYVEHQAVFPRKSDNIIACYVRLERPDGSVDYKVLSREEIEKLRKFSAAPNSKAWTDGLPGMIQAKTLKHAFKSYPRIRLRGQYSKVEEETEETQFDNYDLVEDVNEVPAIEQKPSTKIQPNPVTNGNGVSPSAAAAKAAMTADDDAETVVHTDDNEEGF